MNTSLKIPDLLKGIVCIFVLMSLSGCSVFNKTTLSQGSTAEKALFPEKKARLTATQAFFSESDDFSLAGVRAAALINADTGNVIFSQNGTERFPMASTTKIMTALLLCENAKLSDTVVTTREMVTVEGSSMGLLEGDTVSFEALLYGMMLPSGNDAATTVAIALGGSLEGFALMMNQKAYELGLNDTHFVTPSGLDAENHYTSAEDLARLAAFAMKNKTFKKAASKKSVSLSFGNPPYQRKLFGHNKMLDIYEGATGVKTGFTSKAGKCLVSSAERDGKSLIAVTLKDSSTYSNHSKLLDYGFSRLHKKTLSLPENYRKLEVISGISSSVPIKAATATAFLTPQEFESLTYKISIEKFIYAPVTPEETVGYISFYLGDKLLRRLKIHTSSSVSEIRVRKTGVWEKYILNVKRILKNEG